VRWFDLEGRGRVGLAIEADLFDMTPGDRAVVIALIDLLEDGLNPCEEVGEEGGAGEVVAEHYARREFREWATSPPPPDDEEAVTSFSGVAAPSRTPPCGRARGHAGDARSPAPCWWCSRQLRGWRGWRARVDDVVVHVGCMREMLRDEDFRGRVAPGDGWRPRESGGAQG
jgi:hypothetical protein